LKVWVEQKARGQKAENRDQKTQEPV
jgi:hypothetical protein